MNKKGTVLLWMSAIMFFVTIGIFFMNFQFGEKDVVAYIGETQLKLVQASYQLQNTLLYVDMSARSAVANAVVRLASVGGISDAKECGDYLGYNLWNTETKGCYPDKRLLKDNLADSVDEELSPYLLSYPIALPTNNYDYAIRSDENETQVVGIAKEFTQKGAFKVEGVFDNVRVTHYNTAKESDYTTWYSGVDPTQFPNYAIGKWCAIPESQKGFYEAVLCEGHGISNEGKLYSFTTITTQKETSPPSPTPTPTTTSGTAATVKKTIAVAPDMIPLGSKVKITFKDCKDQALCDQWSGEYIAEDTGPAMIADWKRGVPHIDLYVGIGNDALAASAGLPDFATLEIVGGKSRPSLGMTVSAPPSFNQKINYSLDDYDILIKRSQEFFNILNVCLGRDDAKVCVQSRLNELNSVDPRFEFSLGCEQGNEKVFSDFVELYNDCVNADDDDCTCSFGPQGNVDVILQGKDGKTEILGAGRSYVIDSPWPGASYTMATNTVNNILKKGKTLGFTGENIKRCKLDKKIFRFCARDKTRQVYAYDAAEQKNVVKDVRYRFALFLEDKVFPPPVEGVAVADTLKAERNITLSWQESAASDVVKYKIYFSENQFGDAAFVTLIKEVDDSDANEYSMTYKVADDDKEYWFAITAIDGAGNENRIVTSVAGRSVDDLSPGKVANVLFSADNKLSGTLPSANEDGSAIEESSLSAEVYAVPTDTGSCTGIDLTRSTPVLKQSSSPGSDASMTVTGIAKTGAGGEAINYCFALIARDEAGNPKLSDTAINQAEIVGPHTLS